MGVPRWAECATVGRLVALKTLSNEYVAYSQLAVDAEMSPRGRLVATYALCGFANLGSIGIIVGGLSAIAPTRQADVSALVVRAFFAGQVCDVSKRVYFVC